MGKTITDRYWNEDSKKEMEEALMVNAQTLLSQHGVHNGLGIEQGEVNTLRRAKPSIKNALYVMFLAGQLEIK